MKNPSTGLWAEDKVHFQRPEHHNVYVVSEGKLFLILDNASWHRARDLKDFFFENQHRLVRIFYHRTLVN